MRAVDADPAADRRTLEALARWARRYTPWSAASGLADDGFEGAGAAGLWLDITGCAHFFAAPGSNGEAALLDDLLARLAALGYGARAGLADTGGAAWAVARFAGPRDSARVIVPPTAQAEALAGLPVAGLRLAGATRENLDRLGLRRIGDLTALARDGLTSRFGGALVRRLDQALGREDEPISPLVLPPDLEVRMNFAEPIATARDIRAALSQLVENLVVELEANSLGVRRLDVRVYRLGGRSDRLRVATSRATRAGDHLMRLIDERLARLPPPPGGDTLPENHIEAIVLTVRARAVLAPAQAGLATIGDAIPAVEDGALAGLVDSLMSRLGADAVIRLAPRASHLPERAQVPMAAMDAPSPDTPSCVPPCVPPVARPPRLLVRPEPVFVVAPVPDDPPVLFRWRGRVHHVARADGPERLSAEWWRPASPLGTATRDYYRVEDRDGARFWLYRAGLYRDDASAPPRWFLHGFFG